MRKKCKRQQSKQKQALKVKHQYGKPLVLAETLENLFVEAEAREAEEAEEVEEAKEQAKVTSQLPQNALRAPQRVLEYSQKNNPGDRSNQLKKYSENILGASKEQYACRDYSSKIKNANLPGEVVKREIEDIILGLVGPKHFFFIKQMLQYIKSKKTSGGCSQDSYDAIIFTLREYMYTHLTEEVGICILAEFEKEYAR